MELKITFPTRSPFRGIGKDFEDACLYLFHGVLLLSECIPGRFVTTKFKNSGLRGGKQKVRASGFVP